MYVRGENTVTERFATFSSLLNRINRNVRRIKNREMAEYNLKSPHISCIYHIYREDNMTIKKLCECCEEDKATISRALRYLEANGYLLRKAKLTKRYNATLVLTEKGLEVGKKIADKVDGFFDRIGEALTEEERVVFYRSLFIISDRLKAAASEA